MERDDLKVLARALSPDDPPHVIQLAISAWIDGCRVGIDDLASPIDSHDTVFAIEETLTPEQFDDYLDGLQYTLKLKKRVPDLFQERKWLRHAPAEVCAMALVEVLKVRE